METEAPKDLMETLLDIAATFITPDWGELVARIPLLLLLLVVLYFGWTIRRYATAGPTRRAPTRLPPTTPEHVHMPGPSASPILVALGAGALFLGLVVGGLALWIGVAVLIITMLVWGREAVRDYDRLQPPAAVPAVIHPGPPPGVHLPGPSIRPLLASLGAFALMAGLVFGGWVLVVAAIFLTWTLIGWLGDFAAEYRKVEEADTTGHLENPEPKGWPVRWLQLFAVVFVVVGLFQLGILPTQGPGGAAGGPGASPGPTAGTSLPPGTITVVAKDIAFDTYEIEVPAGQPFAILLRNDDAAGVPHDVDIRDEGGAVLQDKPHTEGGQSQLYEYTPLDPGQYVFICSVHPIPAMTGTLIVR
ncbi:MAG TPA: cupredoxin domain-containing protein [Candidatus Deferrimicrobiaceae bacterium]|nr:cupredoxin domain-containing protein [Candidatus Deferrimicrobiaceae bacterium]